MSRPDDIPQDVWNAAESVAMMYVDWLTPTPTDGDAVRVLAESIARHRLAERETCAVIAEMYDRHGVIAAAIRGGER